MSRSAPRKAAFLRAYRNGAAFVAAAAESGTEPDTVDAWLAEDLEFAKQFDGANRFRSEKLRQRLLDALPEVVEALIQRAKEGQSTAARLVFDYTRVAYGGKDPAPRPKRKAELPVDPEDGEAEEEFLDEIEEIAREIG